MCTISSYMFMRFFAQKSCSPSRKPWSVVTTRAVSSQRSWRSKVVEQLAEQEIAERHDRVVVGAKLLAFLRQFVDAAVARPVADRPVPAGPEFLAEALRRRERLVRIERLDLQQPAVGVAVPIKKVETCGKALDGRKIPLLPDELAIDDVAPELVARVGGELALVIFFAKPLPRRLHHRLPGIALLSADELVGVVLGVIGGAAVLEIVEMVGDEVRVDARRLCSSSGKELSKGSSGPQLRCRKLSRPVCMSRRAGMHGRLPT